MARTQHCQKYAQIWVVRTEPDCFFSVGNSRIGLAAECQHKTKLVGRTAVIRIERKCPLQLDLRFGQCPLTSAKHTQCKVGFRQVRILLQSFKEQLLGSSLILSRRATPPIEQIKDQGYCKVDLCINGLRVDNQRPFKGTLSVLAGL